MSWFEQDLPAPQPDGVATLFALSGPYEPGSLRVYAQGQKLGLACILETDPEGGIFTVDTPEPLSDGWLLEVAYIDPSAPDGILADQIFVVIPSDPIGVALEVAPITADVLEDDAITARIDLDAITAVLDIDEPITVEIDCP